MTGKSRTGRVAAPPSTPVMIEILSEDSKARCGTLYELEEVTGVDFANRTPLNALHRQRTMPGLAMTLLMNLQHKGAESSEAGENHCFDRLVDMVFCGTSVRVTAVFSIELARESCDSELEILPGSISDTNSRREILCSSDSDARFRGGFVLAFWCRLDLLWCAIRVWQFESCPLGLQPENIRCPRHRRKSINCCIASDSLR